MVKILIDKKPDTFDVKNDYGKTPLLLATESNGKFSQKKLNGKVLCENVFQSSFSLIFNYICKNRR